MEKYENEWPQVGEVIQIFETEVELEWYTGTMTGKWKKLLISVKGQRGGRQEWKENVQRKDIILPPFKLTSGGRLPGQIMSLLKDRFHDYF